MLSEKEMLEIAERYLIKKNGSPNDVLVIIPQLTIKKPYGNIYNFNFKRYLETGDFKYSVTGHAPFLVEKNRRRVVQFGTIDPLEDQLVEYENRTMMGTMDTYWYPDEDRFSHK